MSMPYWKIMGGSVSKLVNILKFAKVGIEWYEVSGMRYYIRSGMLLLQTPLGTSSYTYNTTPN